jgi:hypothetical protein
MAGGTWFFEEEKIPEKGGVHCQEKEKAHLG